MANKETGVLDLTEAFVRITRAKELHGEFAAALHHWVESRGVEAQSRRSVQFVCYFGYVKVNGLPVTNLPLKAGEILHNLRVALDYIAFQIYLAGGGTPNGSDAHKVEFPIVDDLARWDQIVARKVPGAWPVVIAELRAVQQLKSSTPQPPPPLPPIDPLLSRLRTLGGTDKHRNLGLFATGAWSASMKSPEPKPWYSVQIRIYQPGPLLPLEPGQKVEVSRVSVGPPQGHPDDIFTWASGIELEKPDPPEIMFGFRANDDTQIDAAELPRVINLVESIAKRFTTMPGPYA